MSDEEQKDAMDAFDQKDEEGADIEAHSLDSLDQKDATEEPPDVEGHSFDAHAAMDAMDQKDA